MTNCCLETKCIQCCKETNMLLSCQDIENIQKKGFEKTFFVQEHNSWFQLKNALGRCVFHNGDICTIYESRPNGCQLYPIVYEKDSRCAILDRECPQKQCFTVTKTKSQQLFTLVLTLERERKQRQKQKRINPSLI